MISTTAELEELVDSTVKIPTIPTILSEITAVLSSPEGSAKQAAGVIEKDPAIATRVLRLVNSSFYGLRNPISSINLACSMLGLSVIKNVVVQATVLQTFGGSTNVENFDVDRLWDHSFKTAVACKLLAELSESAHGLGKDEAYTCGLIHDIGKMILVDSQPDRFDEALRLCRAKKMPLAVAEGELLGFNHAHIGGLLARRWKLAESVQAAVMYHHSPATNATNWVRGFLVKAANTIAHRATTGPNAGYIADVLDDDAMAALGLDTEQLAKIDETVAQTSRQD